MKEDREDRGHTESNSSLKLELVSIGLGLKLRMCFTMYLNPQSRRSVLKN
jgi:hypothetical protein